jgi:hypothetical protein
VDEAGRGTHSMQLRMPAAEGHGTESQHTGRMFAFAAPREAVLTQVMRLDLTDPVRQHYQLERLEV